MHLGDEQKTGEVLPLNHDLELKNGTENELANEQERRKKKRRLISSFSFSSWWSI